MKLKKQKRHRRAVSFYTACFGFRKPFKVLCDGTFIHHMIVNRIIPADTAIANILGAPVKVFTTSCVLAELKSLGASYAESLNAAKSLVMASCDHEKRKSAVNCLIDVIGEKNSEHFFVATQDAELRKKFQEIPGVPLIFGLRNALFLERPSAFQRQFAKAAEEGRSHVTDVEYKIIKTKKIISSGEEMESSDANESDETHSLGYQELESNIRKNGILKDRVQFKRKKTKGPNPLSCKKKKRKLENADNVAPAKEISNSDTTVRSRSEKTRKRKRPRKNKNIMEASS